MSCAFFSPPFPHIVLSSHSEPLKLVIDTLYSKYILYVGVGMIIRATKKPQVTNRLNLSRKVWNLISDYACFFLLSLEEKKEKKHVSRKSTTQRFVNTFTWIFFLLKNVCRERAQKSVFHKIIFYTLYGVQTVYVLHTILVRILVRKQHEQMCQHYTIFKRYFSQYKNAACIW